MHCFLNLASSSALSAGSMVAASVSGILAAVVLLALGGFAFVYRKRMAKGGKFVKTLMVSKNEDPTVVAASVATVSAVTESDVELKDAEPEESGSGGPNEELQTAHSLGLKKLQDFHKTL